MTDYVFGYASLVALEAADALPARLRGFRRCWGVAMNNWEGGEEVKHWLDRATGERPRIRVAYLDIYEQAGSAVNGLALPVDAERLAAFDRREINYERVDVSAAFEPPISDRVFTYIGLDAARERRRQGAADGDVFVSRDYVADVRGAFEHVGAEALAELDRTTDPSPFPERDLQVMLPSSATGS
ncbi:MAG TPA: gamma-glutamylcyclotransferase family protein [Solirubrobacterales bacterium]|nr:gamma-glutamylcyclotransferase family protein [Solirubrobacterales bacterium]